MKRWTGIDEAQMNADIEARIGEMERPDYRFPRRFQRRDYILAAAVAAVCLLLLIGGYYI